MTEKNIIEKIKSGHVTMHSRGFLIWRTALWTLAILLLAAATIFIVSFVFFTLRASGVWDLPQFGLHGLREFLMFFPWLFIPAILLFLWLLERFVLQHSFAYRLPVIYSALILIAVTIFGSIIVLATPLHQRLFFYARRQQLPIAGPVYRFFGRSHPDDFYAGIITAASSSTYSVSNPDGEQMIIITNSGTRFFAPSPIIAGDCIEVTGEEQNGTMTALAIKKTDSQSLAGCVDMVSP